MAPEQVQLYLQITEIIAILLGLALPSWLGYVQLRRILRDFPPHRHTDAGSIVFPDGYEPPREQSLIKSARAGS